MKPRSAVVWHLEVCPELAVEESEAGASCTPVETRPHQAHWTLFCLAGSWGVLATFDTGM